MTWNASIALHWIFVTGETILWFAGLAKAICEVMAVITHLALSRTHCIRNGAVRRGNRCYTHASCHLEVIAIHTRVALAQAGATGGTI